MPRIAKNKRVQRRVVRRRNPVSKRSYLPRMSGQGAYTVHNGPWANRGSTIGGLIGNHYGGSVGKSIGSYIGRRLFHYPARLFGSGSYYQTDSVEKLAPQVPTFTKGEYDDSVCIVHREYLGDIITSSSSNTFKIESYGLNPSEINSFPWLSNIAQPNYQQFKFDSLAFEFKSFSADALNSVNTALGSVFACINYDYTDTDLSSRYEVENTDWSMSCKPSEHMLIPVECKPKQTGMNGLLYVINGNKIPANTDPKTYYLGKLWVGTTGFQGTNVNIGSLYCTYKIRLFKPVMTKPLSNAMISIYTRSGATVAAPFGTAIVSNPVSCDSMGISIDPTGNVLTISKQRLVVGQVYTMILDYYGDVTAYLSRPNFSLSSNISNWVISAGATLNWEDAPYPNVNTGSRRFLECLSFVVNDSSVDASFTGTGTGLLPANCNLFLRINQICGIPPAEIGFV